MTPAVSIIIPTHNRQGLVCRAIDSVLNQSFEDFEMIVIDDGSTDNTKYWLNSYNDPRLRIISTENNGVATARNTGVQASQAKWICFLDSDDLWRKHKLSMQIRFHAENPESMVSITDDVWIRNSVRVNKPKNYQPYSGNLFTASMSLCLISCSSIMMQKNIFLQLGGFNQNMPTCEDYALWLKVTAQHPIGYIDKALVTKFGGHADQLSKKYPVMDLYRIQALEQLLEWPCLKEEQKEAVIQQINIKKNIVTKGAAKREKN